MALCSICFSSLRSGQICATECGHVFHYTCLYTWYNTNPLFATCPSCREKITCWPSITRLHLDFGEDTTQNNSIVEDLHQNVISMSAKLKEIDHKLSSTDCTAKLRQEITELKAINKDLNKQLTQENAISMSAKLRAMEIKLASTEKKYKTLLKTKEVYQERAAKLRQEITILKATNKDLNKQLTQENKQRKFYENECLALTAQVDELENN